LDEMEFGSILPEGGGTFCAEEKEEKRKEGERLVEKKGERLGSLTVENA